VAPVGVTVQHPSVTRVASRYLASRHVEAGVSDWLRWIVQPWSVLVRRSGDFVSGPVDDAMDNVFRELAPEIVAAIGEREVDADVDEFATGAIHGRSDARTGLFEDDEPSWSNDYRAGYRWGYANAATWEGNALPDDVRGSVVRENVREFRGEVTEHLVEEALHKAWHAVNPVETVKTMIAAVRQHGWKVGIGIALFELLEHTVLPTALIALTGRPEMAVTGTLPLGEILLPIILRAVGNVPAEANAPTPDGHLDWYTETYGSMRLAARAPRGTPTDTNMHVLDTMIAENGGVIPSRVPSVHFPHLRRVLDAGFIEPGPGGFVLTPAGERALSEWRSNGRR